MTNGDIVRAFMGFPNAAGATWQHNEAPPLDGIYYIYIYTFEYFL